MISYPVLVESRKSRIIRYILLIGFSFLNFEIGPVASVAKAIKWLIQLLSLIYRVFSNNSKFMTVFKIIQNLNLISIIIKCMYFSSLYVLYSDLSTYRIICIPKNEGWVKTGLASSYMKQERGNCSTYKIY